MSYLNQIDFTADVRAIYDQSGKIIDPQLGRGVYRDDTDELMAVCGPNFKPVQHKEVVDPVLHQLEKSGYKLEERPANKSALYDLKGKKGAFLDVQMTDGGAVMRTDIILGDFIEPTGSSSYLKKGEDTNFFRVSLLNSHNSKYAVRANTSYLRLVCLNGMTQPHFSANAYGKHTQNFNIDGLQAQIGNAFGMMGEDADRFGLMARTPINVKQAEEMLQKTIAKLPNKANGDPHFSAPLVNKILTQFQREDQTVWGLLNACTWWQTHSEMRSNADPVTATIGREQKVASMLKSNPWQEFMAAA